MVRETMGNPREKEKERKRRKEREKKGNVRGEGWWQSGQMRQTVNLFPYRYTGSNPVHPRLRGGGWMPEWLNGLVLKTRVAQTRGFESRSIRREKKEQRSHEKRAL